MAAPVVAAVTEGGLTTAGTSLAVTLPSGGASTDVYVVIIAKGSVANTINALTDWTEYLDENAATGFCVLQYTGTGVPSNPTFTQSVASRSVWTAFRITGGSRAVALQVGTTATGSSTTPDPPSVTVTGGPKDVLGIACLSRGGEEADDDTWLTANPSGYTGRAEKAGGTGGTNLAGILGAASLEIFNTSTVNPGTFTIATGAWRAQTIVVHPVPPTSTAVGEVSLADPADTPAVNTGHVVWIRARYSAGTGVIRCALYEGANNRSGDMSSTVIGSGTEALLQFPISEANAANITAYTDLRIKFWGYSDTGATGDVEIDQIYLEVPGVAGPAVVDMAAVVAASGAVTGEAVRTRAVAASPAALGAVAAAVAVQRSIAATVAGLGAIASQADRLRAIAAVVAGQGAVVVDSTRIIPIAATVAGQAALVAEFVRTRGLAVAPAGQGTIVADLSALRTIAATVAGQAAATVAMSPTRALGVVVTGQGVVAGDMVRVRALAVTIDGLGSITVSVDVTGPAGGTVTFDAVVSAQGAVTVDVVRQRAIAAVLAAQGQVVAPQAVLRAVAATIALGPRRDEWWLLDTLDATGTFTLTWRGQTTGAISAPHTDGDVTSALEALSNVDPGDLFAFGGGYLMAGGQYASMAFPTSDLVLNGGGLSGSWGLFSLQSGRGGPVISAEVTRERAIAATPAAVGAVTAQADRIRGLTVTVPGVGTVVVDVQVTPAGTFKTLDATVAGVAVVGAALTRTVGFFASPAGQAALTAAVARTRALRVYVRRRNMLDDGGFELGLNMWTTASVTPTVITSPTMHGKYAARVTRLDSGIFPRIYQFASLVPTGGEQQGLTYVGSVYIYGEAANEGKQLRITLSEHGGELPSVGTDYIHTIALGWQRVSVERTIVDNDRVGLFFYVLMHGTWAIGESFIMDSGQLEWISTPAQGPSEYIDTKSGPSNAPALITADAVRTRNMGAKVEPNLWRNSSFENGMQDVTPVGTPTPTLSLDNTVAKHGAQSLKIVGSDGFIGFIWAQRNLKVGPANKYFSFSWWMRCLEEQQQEIEWRFWNDTPSYLGGATLSNYHFGTLFDPQGWERYETTFEVPANTTWFELIVDTRIAGDDFGTLPATFWVDAAMLTTEGVTAYMPDFEAVTVDMVRTRGLAASLAGQGTVAVDIARVKAMAASVAASGNVVAALGMLKLMGAAVAANGAVTASARATRALNAIVAGQAQASVTLGALKLLAATVQGVGQVTVTHQVRVRWLILQHDDPLAVAQAVEDTLLLTVASDGSIAIVHADDDVVDLTPSGASGTLVLVGAGEEQR